MNKNNGPLSWLKKRLAAEDQPDKKKANYKYLTLVLGMGAAFMIFGNLMLDKEKPVAETVLKAEAENKVPAFGQNSPSKKGSIDSYEHAYETQLTEALEDMLGVDDVTVVVNLESTETKVLEKNKVSKNQTTSETDREGGKRRVEDSSVDEQLVIIRNGEKEVPIIVETKKPEIRGVLVVARGADNIEVKKWIREAVTRALGVPSHRVAVMPKKTKGD